MFIEILRLLRREARRFGGPRRFVVCPPALLEGPAAWSGGWRTGLREWLSSGWSAAPLGTAARTSRPVARAGDGNPRLHKVREEFLQAVEDIRTQQVGMLQGRVRIAASLRELWHLRPEVFRVVALHFSQTEAQLRLDRLNRHFPTRSPRSGFAPLESQTGDAGRPPRR